MDAHNVTEDTFNLLKIENIICVSSLDGHSFISEL